MTPPSRSRDADRTRAAILRAAQQAFATRGYTEVGLREITAAAEVNLSLVNRYFGSKEKLFEAALEDLLDVSVLTDQPRACFGEGLMAIFTSPASDRIHPLPVLVLAAGDPSARSIADRLLRDAVLTPLSQWFDGPAAEERAARLCLVTLGFFAYRLVYPLDVLSGSVAPATREWLVRTLQSIVDDAQ